MPKRKRTKIVTLKVSKPKFSKPQVEIIKKIARKAVDKKSETKVAWFNISNNLQDSVFTSWNLMYQSGLANGTEGENSKLIGDRFNMKGIRVRAFINMFSSGSIGDLHLDLMVVETDVYKTTASLGRLDLVPGYAPTLPGFPVRIDSSKARVLKRKRIKLKSTITGIIDTKAVDMYVKYDKMCRFSGDTSGTYDLDGKNLYLVAYQIQQGAATPGTTNVAQIIGQCEFFYKDP